MIGYKILLPANQNTREYEKWHMDPYVLMNLNEVISALASLDSVTDSES